MSRRKIRWVLGMLALALGIANAQDTSAPAASASGQVEQQPGPVPAYGQENTPLSTSENPPLSGIDLPSLEPNAAPLSVILNWASEMEK